MKKSVVKQIIKEELDHIAPKVIAELDIDTPVYDFDNAGNFVAAAHAKVEGDMFCIRNCWFDGRISFNPEKVYSQAKNIFNYIPQQKKP